MHTRISSPRKIRSKTGSKTGLKPGPGQHPITGNAVKQANPGSQPGQKSRSKTTLKMMGKSTCKIPSGVRVPTWHFSKARCLSQMAFRSRNYQKAQKRGPNTVFARCARRLTQTAFDKKGPKKEGKNPAQNQLEIAGPMKSWMKY